MACAPFRRPLIPISWLKRFEGDLRRDIAERIAFPNETQMWELPRDDGGPPLRLYKPNVTIDQRFSADEHSTITYDPQGFCNPPRDSYERPHIELIALGDSFAGCVGGAPESTWVSRIGEVNGWSVYNLGRGGIGPYDYLQILKRFGLPKEPRIVLMNIYEGNDLRDSLRYHEHLEAGAGGGFASASDRFEPELDYRTLLDNPLGRHSYAANLALVAVGKVYDGIGKALARAAGEAAQRVDFRYDLRFGDVVVPFNIQNADQSEVRHARRLRQGAIRLGAFDLALERFAALAAEHGFRPVVSYAPSAYTAYGDFVVFEDDSLTELMPWFSRTQRDYLRTKAAALGIAFIDLVPPLQAAARDLQASALLYYRANVHYTPAGHRVVGDALAAALAALDDPKPVPHAARD